jgi:hypothetical protein
MSGHVNEYFQPEEYQMANQWAQTPHVQNMQNNQQDNYFNGNLRTTLAAAIDSSPMDQ